MCYFGTLGNQFQFDKLIEIAEKIKDEEIDICMCGIGPQYEMLKEKSKEIKIIKMLNWLNKDELQYVLQNSKIGIANYKPTFDFQMGASNKFAEYLSHGLPVILTSGGFMGELIDKFDCGINSDDTNKIVEYILTLKGDYNCFNQKSENAYNLFKKQFDAKIVYSELVDYLEKIVKS